MNVDSKSVEPKLAEWPRTFPYSPRLATLKRNTVVIILVSALPQVGEWFVDHNPIHLILPVLILLLSLLALRSWGHRPAAKLWPDHAELPYFWWPDRLIPVSYAEIVRLEKIPEVRLDIFYGAAKTRKVRLPVRMISGIEELETILRTRTGLELQIRRPFWSQYEAAVRLDEPGSVLDHFGELLTPA